MPADEVSPVLSSNLFEGITYLIEASGTADAGANITFDAKYSTREGCSLVDVWTDDVCGYTSYGSELLDLQLNGESVEWGVYNEDHIYEYEHIGDGNPLELHIYDIYSSNNTGSLFADIYAKLW